MIGADGAIGGFTVLAEWRAAGVVPPKDRDFALGLGPVVVTPRRGRALRDGRERASTGQPRSELAATGTALYPGDIVAAPGLRGARGQPGGVVTVEIAGIGALEQRVAPA